MVRFLYILPTGTKWGHFIFEVRITFFYVNRVVLINLGRFYLCLAVVDPGFLKRGSIVNFT